MTIFIKNRETPDKRYYPQIYPHYPQDAIHKKSLFVDNFVIS